MYLWRAMDGFAAPCGPHFFYLFKPALNYSKSQPQVIVVSLLALSSYMTRDKCGYTTQCDSDANWWACDYGRKSCDGYRRAAPLGETKKPRGKGCFDLAIYDFEFLKPVFNFLRKLEFLKTRYRP